MKKSAVLYVIGVLLLVLGVAQTVPLAVAWIYESDQEIRPFVISIGTSLGVGLVLFFTCRRFADPTRNLRAREGFVVVSLGWIALSVFGAIPFVLTPGGIPSWTDALFETLSGFTTTGASILRAPEELPRGLLFWRSFTHWFGGMGIVVLTVAILPFLGAGGYQLLRAEVPGPTADRLAPRIAETAKTLWVIYVLLTAVEIVLLLPAMDLFDASCHAFGTLATGGFSTRNASVDSFASVYVEVVIMVFMILAGFNFVLHVQALRGRRLLFLRDSEARFYLGLIAIAIVVITGFLWLGHFPDRDLHPDKYDSLPQCLRYASFQVASIVTTTGYGTADFDGWPNACRFLLLLMMVVGGCAGSTSGGVKCVRILLMLKYGLRELLRIIRPHAVVRLRVGDQPVTPEVVSRVMGFLALWFLLFAVAVVVLTLILDATPAPDPEGLRTRQAVELEHRTSFETALGGVLAALGNIGPGLGTVGPVQNYAAVPEAGKILLILCMLLGRLEIYCVLILFLPSTWRT